MRERRDPLELVGLYQNSPKDKDSGNLKRPYPTNQTHWLISSTTSLPSQKHSPRKHSTASSSPNPKLSEWLLSKCLLQNPPRVKDGGNLELPYPTLRPSAHPSHSPLAKQSPPNVHRRPPNRRRRTSYASILPQLVHPMKQTRNNLHSNPPTSLAFS